MVLLASRVAWSADVEVQADTAVQLYEIRNPWGDPVLERRRMMQTIHLAAHNLRGTVGPKEPVYSVALRLRLDADFGMNNHVGTSQAGAETHFDALNGTRFVPGLREAPLDLMYGYVEGRNLAGGALGFRFGRQYVTDVLGWWSFDGALVRVTTPFYVQAEVYGGFEQRGGLPLSTSRYERQGIWRGSHAGFDAGAGTPSLVDYPSYQPTQPAPAFGVALESAGTNWVHGRFTYRRVYNLGGSVTQQFPDPAGGYRFADGTRLSQERLGYAADATLSTFGALRGGLSYDLYSSLFATAYGGADVYLHERVTAGVDADHFVPTFDGDSIWNWFSRSPMTTLQGRLNVGFTREFDVSASGGARLWHTEGDPETFAAGQCAAVTGDAGPGCPPGATFDPSREPARSFTRDEANRGTKTTADALAQLGGRYRWRSGVASLRGMLQTGERGRRTGADAATEKQLDGGRYTLGGRVSLYDWHDPLRPDRSATSFGYVLAGGVRPGALGDLRVEWEHDMNRLVGHRFRVVALMSIRVMQ